MAKQRPKIKEQTVNPPKTLEQKIIDLKRENPLYDSIVNYKLSVFGKIKNPV